MIGWLTRLFSRKADRLIDEEAPDFQASFDARYWAKAFVTIAEKHPDVAIDEATMLGWFANALMRGFDEHHWMSEKQQLSKVYVLDEGEFYEVSWPDIKKGMKFVCVEMFQGKIKIEVIEASSDAFINPAGVMAVEMKTPPRDLLQGI
jgi:hypothetical protein